MTNESLPALPEPARQLPAAPAPSLFLNPGMFETAQRAAKALVRSPLVPKQYRIGQGQSEEEAIANCLIALNVADRMGEDPLTIMQSLSVINGRLAWDASFMMARANASGRFREEIDFEEEGQGTDAYRVRAYAMRPNGKKVYGTWVSMSMAKEEGWTRNTKYKSMPEHMLKFRAIGFFVRQRCPEVMGAVRHTVEEAEDMRLVGESGPAPRPAADEPGPLRRQALSQAPAVPQVANVLPQTDPAVIQAPAKAPAKELFPEPNDDFNSGRFIAEAMAQIRTAQSRAALDDMETRWHDQLGALKHQAPKSHDVVIDALKRRRESVE